MRAVKFSRFCSRTALLAATTASLVASTSSCVRKANVVMVPVPIQLVGGDSHPKMPLVGPRWHRIDPGMSKDDVIRFVGEPTRRDYEGHFTNGHIETWYFDSYDLHDGRFDPHYVRFEHGRVVYAAFDERRLRETRAKAATEQHQSQMVLEIPADVGFHCESDRECQSKKCVNKQCAGPHGCTRVSGSDCVTDSDCCSGQCIAARFCK